MAPHSGWFRGRFSSERARRHIGRGRQLLGEVMARATAFGGLAPVQTRRVTLADGTRIRAGFDGTTPLLDIQVSDDLAEADERLEEVVYAYVGSPGGLRVFDLGTRRLVSTVTGLEPFEVNDVSATGRIVYLTGQGQAARVDLSTQVAFGIIYGVNGLKADGGLTAATAQAVGARLSPDGSRVLVAFDRTFDAVTSVSLDGLGGWVLADATTLQPVRPAIRMTFRPQAVAWVPGSDLFCLAVARADDPGDAPSTAVTTSITDYVALFNIDGALLGVRSLAQWPFTPSASFGRLVTALAVNDAGTRLYAMTRPPPLSPGVHTIHVLDLGFTSMPVVGTLALTSDANDDAAALNVHRSGNRLTVRFVNGDVGEIDIGSDTPTLIHRTANPLFAATTQAGLDQFRIPAIRNGPLSRAGQAPDTRQFLLGPTDDTLRGWRGFDDLPVYEFLLAEYAVKDRFALAAVGIRRAA